MNFKIMIKDGDSPYTSFTQTKDECRIKFSCFENPDITAFAKLVSNFILTRGLDRTLRGSIEKLCDNNFKVGLKDTNKKLYYTIFGTNATLVTYIEEDNK